MKNHRERSAPKYISTVALIIAIIGTFVVLSIDISETLNNYMNVKMLDKNERDIIISGQVFNLNGGVPIGDAKIVFEYGNTFTFTDSFGRFEVTIEAIKSRKEFSFYIIKDGYTGIYRSKDLVTQDSIINLNLGLLPIE